LPKTQSWIVEHGSLCTATEPVPCTTACPLGVDVRTMLIRLSKGDFDGARLQIEQDIPFPKIVCRVCSEKCRSKCERNELGGSIEVRSLERAILDYSEEKPARRFARRRKKGKIVVVGGGICGMTCAYALGRRGYDVELHTSRDSLGGRLRTLPEEMLPEEVLDEAEDIVREFAEVKFEHMVTDLDELDWDACIVATGAGSNEFGLNSEQGHLVTDPITRQTSREGVFAAGGSVGDDDVVSSMAESMSVCISVERLLRGGSLTIDRVDTRERCSKLHVNLENAVPKAGIAPVNGVFAKDEAVAEASRCLLCECDFCMTTCELLSSDARKPYTCVNDLSETLSAVAKHSSKVAMRKSNMCSVCNLCGVRCPNGLDMGELYLETRRILRERGELPPAFHDFWLRDMDHALGSSAAFTVIPDSGDRNGNQNFKTLGNGSEDIEPCENPDLIYFPGCSMGASDPDLVEASYRMLRDATPNKVVALDVGCCGAPAMWAGDEKLFQAVVDRNLSRWRSMGFPTVVVGCPTCRKMVESSYPDVTVTSLLEMLDRSDLPKSAVHVEGEEISLFDPCSARLDPNVRKAARSLLTKMGYKIEEMYGNGDLARCCGFGGLIYGADPDFARKVTDVRIRQAHHDIVTYCSNCRDVFSSQGARASHILSLLMGFEGQVEMPPLGMRRENREALKTRFTGIQTQTNPKAPEILLDDGIIEKMNAQLILKEEVQRAIASSYQTGEQLLDEQTGWTITHLQIGIITLWVFFEKIGENRFAVHNVYSHRMALG
jgi:Fe-S oxidoreductase